MQHRMTSPQTIIVSTDTITGFKFCPAGSRRDRRGSDSREQYYLSGTCRNWCYHHREFNEADRRELVRRDSFQVTDAEIARWIRIREYRRHRSLQVIEQDFYLPWTAYERVPGGGCGLSIYIVPIYHTGMHQSPVLCKHVPYQYQALGKSVNKNSSSI
jgi:hypothetical protein